MKRYRKPVPAVLLLLFAGFSLHAQQLPASFQAWSGEWIAERPSGKVHELWTQEKDGSMRGSSWIIKSDSDSVYQESIRLYAENDSVIYYSPFVPDQHSAPVPFRLIRQGGNEWLFHNAGNDFPKYIGYHLLSDDRLIARIGNEPGFREKPFVVFEFRRVK